MSSKAMSSMTIEELRELIVTSAPDCEWQCEEWRWLFQGERDITMVYWKILDRLKKEDALERVRGIIDGGEVEIARMRHAGRTGLNKHMEEWEKGR